MSPSPCNSTAASRSRVVPQAPVTVVATAVLIVTGAVTVTVMFGLRDPGRGAPTVIVYMVVGPDGFDDVTVIGEPMIAIDGRAFSAAATAAAVGGVVLVYAIGSVICPLNVSVNAAAREVTPNCCTAVVVVSERGRVADARGSCGRVRRAVVGVAPDSASVPVPPFEMMPAARAGYVVMVPVMFVVLWRGVDRQRRAARLTGRVR